jgi:hypothetical protein
MEDGFSKCQRLKTVSIEKWRKLLQSGSIFRAQGGVGLEPRMSDLVNNSSTNCAYLQHGRLRIVPTLHQIRGH